MPEAPKMTTRCCRKSPRYAFLVFVTLTIIIATSLIATLNVSSSHSLDDNDESSNVSSSLLQTNSKGETTSQHRLSPSTILSLPPTAPSPPSIQRLSVDPNVEYVKPKKLLILSDPDDLVHYDDKSSSGLSPENPNELHSGHATGNFRHKNSRIWDPHPSYEIDAFGMHMRLVLTMQGDDIIPKTVKVTHVWENKTQQKKDDHEHHDKIRNCFYKGSVKGDKDSRVLVSLCGGMTGHIHTSNGTFTIRPIEQFDDENVNIEHEIKRALPHKHDHVITSSSSSSNKDKDSHCDVGDSDELKSMNAIHHLKDHQLEYLGNFTTDLPPAPYDQIRRKRSIYASTHNSHNSYQNSHSSTSSGSSSSSSSSSSSNSHNNEYTIEVLVAVDKKMQEKHGDNLQEYVLTLMSTVSSIYSDASIGNLINVAVVHIMLVKHDLVQDAKDGKGVSASAMLIEFCDLKQRYNFHHDTAILLTREQICRSVNKTNCDTLGLAELGTMCKPKSCAIIQDNGLSAAFTIAHELGHVLNMPHDDDQRCLPYRGSSTEKQNIMSRMLDANTNPWSWSACSRHFVTEYIEQNHGTCLLNKPQRDMMDYPDSTKLAGEKFTDNQQCELAVGRGSKICSYMPVCSRLWCTQTEHGEADGCATQHMPWADGTSCGDSRWCQKGECVLRERGPAKPVDGGWGDWSDYDACTRTCGGGIQWSKRECNAPKPVNGGRYCQGQRTRHRSCNTQECPADEPDFREKQCSYFNTKDQHIRGIKKETKWVPKYGVYPNEECKLYCRAQNTHHYFVLLPRVVDGTTCSHDTFDKCVNGRCEKAGCDNVLASKADLDRCGICEGRNETCRDVNGSLKYEEVYASGSKTYHKVVRIPKGAANIEIRQLGYINDHNFISLVDDTGKRILNKPNEISDYTNVKLHYGGVTFIYNGAETQTEELRSINFRKLKRDLVVELFMALPMRRIDENIVTYSFSMSTTERNYLSVHHEHQQRQQQLHQQQQQQQQVQQQQQQQQAIPHYSWKLSDWNDCDQVCSGKRRRTANCYELNSGQMVETNMAAKYCSRSAKPQDEYDQCNVECKLEWEVTTTGECSEVCGDGVRPVTSVCLRRDTRNGNTQVIDSGYCPTSTRPASFDKCYGSCPDAMYSHGEWEPCSVTCGGGVQYRNVTCVSRPNGKTVDEKFCSNMRHQKIAARRCNEEQCPEWIQGEPGTCSVTCGEGIAGAKAECKFKNKTVDESLCVSYPRPVATYTTCSMPKCATTTTKNPNHHEYFEDNNNPIVIQSSIGSLGSKPIRISSNSVDHTKYEWRTGAWSECSATCGFNGTKTRTVRCMARQFGRFFQEIVDDSHCDEYKPVNQTPCNSFRCPEWNMELWSECKDDCKKYRNVFCQDHRGKISDTCPEDLRPPSVEQCDCHIKWGSLWKPCSASCGSGVRVRDIVCMKINKKSLTNPHPRRNAKILDDNHCAHMEKPRPGIMERPCKSKRNCSFRWFTGPWSKCPSGCGTGYATRNVYCTDGTHKDYSQCDIKEKPMKSKVCDSMTHCRWRTGKWKHCSCSGYTKRRVACIDTLQNVQSNSCVEDSRPVQRQRCTPPPNCSCRTLQQSGVRKDGEHMLNIRGRQVSIYCHNMTSNKPLEFLTLKAGITENYSIYYSKRAREGQQCGDRNSEQSYPDDRFGTTRFHKIRLDIQSLKVIDDDFTFTDTASKPQSFGSAGDCYSNSMKCPQGDFSINLVGTRFRIRPKTQWEVSGQNSEINFVLKLEPPYQRVRARCGGYCGSCYPARNTSLFLELLS